MMPAVADDRATIAESARGAMYPGGRTKLYGGAQAVHRGAPLRYVSSAGYPPRQGTTRQRWRPGANERLQLDRPSYSYATDAVTVVAAATDCIPDDGVACRTSRDIPLPAKNTIALPESLARRCPSG